MAAIPPRIPGTALPPATQPFLIGGNGPMIGAIPAAGTTGGGGTPAPGGTTTPPPTHDVPSNTFGAGGVNFGTGGTAGGGGTTTQPPVHDVPANTFGGGGVSFGNGGAGAGMPAIGLQPPLSSTPSTPAAGTGTPPTTTTPPSGPTSPPAGGTPAPNPTPAPPTQHGGGHCDHPGTVNGGGPSGLRAGGRAGGVRRPIGVAVGKARFQFPPTSVSDRSNRPPAITYGPGWTQKTDASGRSYMQHENGTKVYESVQGRATVAPKDRARIKRLPGGAGRQFPDGTILSFRNGKPYLVPGGYVKFGTRTIDGVRVRLFQAREATVTTPDGRQLYYDSRGNQRFGSNARAARAAAIGGGGTGVQQIGGGPAALSGLINDLIAMTRGILEQLEGESDPGTLAQAHSLLNRLPAALGQSVSGAANSMSSHAAHH